MYSKHSLFIMLISIAILISGCKTAETNENAGGKNIAGNEQVSNKVTDKNTENNDSKAIKNDISYAENAENSSEYNNPYYCDWDDLSYRGELYHALSRNAVHLSVNVSRTFAENYWDEIVIVNYPEKHDYKLNFTEEEKQSFLYLVHAAVNGGSIEALAVIALTEDNPEGKISRVVYRTNGKEWKNEAYGFGNKEIADAYTNILWQEAFA